MEYIAPSMEFLRKLQAQLKNGKALGSILPELIAKREDPFHKQMRCWWFHYKNGTEIKISFPTHYQQSLASILESGLNGAPILEHLEHLDEEMENELQRQMRAHLDQLPFKLLLPLMLFFFPAFVLLLFGPLLNHFLREVGL